MATVGGVAPNVDLIVRTTLEPILARLRGADGLPPLPAQILDLKICDLAMGSAAFLVASDKERIMFQKLTAVVLIGTALVLAACNTVRGAATDVNSVANCTQNTMNDRRC